MIKLNSLMSLFQRSAFKSPSALRSAFATITKPKSVKTITLKEFKQFIEAGDKVMYSNNNKTHVLSLRIFSVFQILFWVNFGQLAYTKLGKVDEETNQPKLYESWKRGLALFLAMGLGSAISATIWFYSSKCVSRITLLKGGKSMNLEVYKFPLTTKQIKLPVEQLACSKRFTDGLAQLPTPNSEKRFYLRDLESRLSYVIDLRAKFSSPQILDHLLYKPGAFKK